MRKLLTMLIAITIFIIILVISFNYMVSNEKVPSKTKYTSRVEQSKEQDKDQVKEASQVKETTSVEAKGQTRDQAKEIALKEAKTGQVIGYEQDYDFGKLVYEIVILDGKLEKEYKIDSQTGKILKTEIKDLSIDPENKLLLNTKPKIDLTKADSLVKQKYPNARVKKLKLDVENNVLVYDVNLIEANKEIEVRLDANTGVFTHEEIETDHD
ncbi:PepSY domain-containing protein [Peptostreptococcus stomatis]|uniref:PepSY domain-containing protein n=1 Tax=Peptostreptococcus stomatis TaxID=341694 RepID=UPI0028DB7EC7|nr:PepSY domain-containing protein [Peptostreptococcus stomatis]